MRAHARRQQSSGSPGLRALGALLLALGLVLAAPPAAAQQDADEPASEQSPRLRPPTPLGPLAGRTITRIDVVTLGGRWPAAQQLRRARVGESVSAEVARRAMRELLDSGRFATAEARFEADGEGARLVVEVLPRRLIATLRVSGSPFELGEVLRAGELREQGEVTVPRLAEIRQRIRALHQRRGFPSAKVEVTASDTDDPLLVVLYVEIVTGAPRRIAARRFAVWPSTTVPGIRESVERYPVVDGDRLDLDALHGADEVLTAELRERGFSHAHVSHRVRNSATGPLVEVLVRAGPRIRLVFEGNRRFDASQLEDALSVGATDDRSPSTLAAKLEDYYRQRGLLDVEVGFHERGKPTDAYQDLVFRIRERNPVRVVTRSFACLSGPRSAAGAGEELDRFLTEELPGPGVLRSVDPRVVDTTFGPRQTTGSRVAPFEPSPASTFDPATYERAVKHLQDLYRSEGYLSAQVGPVELLRRRCDPRSQPNECIPIGPRRTPRTPCRYDEVGVPLPEPAVDARLVCRADTASGLRCEPDAVLHIPVKLGPLTTLYDLAFDGNKVFVESALEAAAELQLGKPASQIELDKARRRVLDAYAEEGFAFADVEAELELSPDRTRARARFVISERQRVIVSGIVVRGAQRTNESLIRSRVALKTGQPYRRSWVRATEERLATLGVFSAITVGFEDPYVPAREKVVVITLSERKPQYLDVRPGFSSGEGFRITFEYGHRNLGGEAIQLTLRSQLGYLPTGLILEEDVRNKYDELDVGQRIERRNSATVEFPDVGLGPLFRFSVEGIDVRDNARDYGITKDAGITTLIFRPSRRFSATLGASLELNRAEIFGSTQKGALEEYVRNNPRLRNSFRVPEGTTVAVAQRIGVTWDRRDNPLGAASGTLISASVEHVRATPVGEDEQSAGDTSVFAATTSQFLRSTSRIAGYVRLSDRGLALAASFRWGLNTQLISGSRTYPDRLFFLGGVDSLRGFLQDSLVPQDIADELLKPGSELSLREVVIRGGDVFVNPRLELRVPLSGDVQTALFFDSGNLWTRPELIEPLRLRHAIGSGLRIGTPVGPLAFDYGFNVDRILDEVDPTRQNQRFWEDIGAFHFSIGLF